MNENVIRLISRLFNNAADTEATRMLREEVENNCQEHFADLLSQGKSEQEALQVLKESLEGLDELIQQANLPAAVRKECENSTAPEREPRLHLPQKGAEPFRAPENEKSAEYPGEWQFPATEIRRVKAQTQGAPFRVVPVSGETARVTCSPARPMECFVRDGEMHISYDSRKAARAKSGKTLREGEHATFMDVLQTFLSNLSVHVGADDPEITLFIPDDPARGYVVSTASGNITLEGSLNTSDIMLTSASGDIRAEGDLSGKSIRLETVSGDISVSGGTKADELQIKSISGDANLTASCRSAALTSTSGDLTLQGQCGQLSLRSVSGDLDVNGSAGNVTASTTSGDLCLSFSGAPKHTELRSVSGDIRLRLGGEDRSVHFQTHTVSGEVSLRLPDAGVSAKAQVILNTVSGDITAEE